MKESQAVKIIIKICEITGQDPSEFDIHHNYSGRSMYGDTTCAISFSNPNLPSGCLLIGRAVEQLVQEDETFEEITELGSDQLGLGYVVY